MHCKYRIIKATVLYRFNCRWCIYTGSGLSSSCEVSANVPRYWTAGQGTDTGGPFVWKVQYSNGTVVDQPMTYTNWAYYQPYHEGQQYCLSLKGEDNYMWTSMWSCTYTFCYVCEIYPWRPCRPWRPQSYDHKFNRPISMIFEKKRILYTRWF